MAAMNKLRLLMLLVAVFAMSLAESTLASYSFYAGYTGENGYVPYSGPTPKQQSRRSGSPRSNKPPNAQPPPFVQPEDSDNTDTEPAPASPPPPSPPPAKPAPQKAAPSSPVPAAPSNPAPAGGSSSGTAAWLSPHNQARVEVGVAPLVWDDDVAAYAQGWASQRQAAGCGLQHSGGPYGENIFWGSGGYEPADCVAAWVAEKANYDYADNTCSNGDCGHYTQVVWANSIHLGCARAVCDDGSVFMTCNYDPPGNFIGARPF